MVAATLYGCPGKDTETAEVVETVTTSVTLPGGITEGAQCAECGMYVEVGGRFSCEAITSGGKLRYFCDIGDLLIHLANAGKDEIASANVRDYNSGRWVSAYEAFYLTEIPERTPMRFGIAAFASRPDAEAFRAKNGGGTIYTYAGIQTDKPYE